MSSTRRRSSVHRRSTLDTELGEDEDEAEEAEDQMADALGLVVSTHTAALRKKTSANSSAIQDLKAQLVQLDALARQAVAREAYTRESDELRHDVKEALEQANRAASNASLSGHRPALHPS